ncbi:MAG: endonuclease [Desulfurococcaceae archaeon]
MSSADVVIKLDESTCRGYVDDPSHISELAERWFGKLHFKRLVLDLVEVAYIVSQLQGKAVVLDSQGRAIKSIEGLVEVYGKCFESLFWPMLSVLKDLRERGRRVRVLEPMKFLVKDKEGELRLIYILEEKSIINIDSLTNIVEEARRNNLKASLAIVSLQGELTYYDLNQAEIKVN